MRFSKTSVLALDALAFISREGSTSPVPLRQIADKLKASPTYLSKILQQLSSASLIMAVMGARGGYRLCRDTREISVLEVVELFEKPATVGGEPPTSESDPNRRTGTGLLSKVLIAARDDLSKKSVADLID